MGGNRLQAGQLLAHGRHECIIIGEIGIKHRLMVRNQLIRLNPYYCITANP